MPYKSNLYGIAAETFMKTLQFFSQFSNFTGLFSFSFVLESKEVCKVDAFNCLNNLRGFLLDCCDRRTIGSKPRLVLAQRLQCFLQLINGFDFIDNRREMFLLPLFNDAIACFCYL